MHYIIFGLGILLACAGCLSIYAGYDIVEIERGWTEVIAGTTLFTGGVVTIALGTILRRLKSLSDLYSAAQPLTVPDSVSVKAPALALNPLSAPVATMQIGQTGDALPENLRGQDLHQADLRPDAYDLSHDATANAAYSVQQPDVSYEPQPVLPDYATTTPPPQPASSALSLDDMWKRVSNAMAKPIFSSRPNEPAVSPPIAEAIPTSQTHAPEVAIDEPFADTAPLDHDEFGLNPSKNMNVIDSDRLERDAGGKPVPAFPHPVLGELSERPAERSPIERHEALNITAAFLLSEPEPKKAAAVDAPAPGTLDHDDFGLNQSKIMNVIDSNNLERDAGGKPVPTFPHPALEDELASEPNHAVPDTSNPAAVDPEPAGPAMIGRYEAEGTSYLMFSDGSIEAQSESGVFHFASMAELKAFIEDKQAAVT